MAIMRKLKHKDLRKYILNFKNTSKLTTNSLSVSEEFSVAESNSCVL